MQSVKSKNFYAPMKTREVISRGVVGTGLRYISLFYYISYVSTYAYIIVVFSIVDDNDSHSQSKLEVNMMS